MATLGVAAIGLSALIHPAPRLVWNASASAPRGLYWVGGAAVARGDLVLARLPEAVRQLAAARGYLPAGVPLVKRIAAVGGDVVCGSAEAVSINGRVVAARLAADAHRRPLPAWTGCLSLGIGEVFLLMDGVADSFDGRYFGATPTGAIIGRLVPLWTE